MTPPWSQWKVSNFFFKSKISSVERVKTMAREPWILHTSGAQKSQVAKPRVILAPQVCNIHGFRAS
jgi:hypothetical protein